MKHAPLKLSALIRDENLHSLHGGKKLQYIWDYYKLPLVIVAILLYVIFYILYNHFTEKSAFCILHLSM